ncbi:DUF927 domain-containing protein [Palleronia marisminoris]|nr:DUF927 domain-containing protein [Palleronia marisminoris]
MEEELPRGYLYFLDIGLLYQLTKAGDYAPVCSPIRVLRRLRTPDGTGRPLEIALRDFDGRIRTVIVPVAELSTRPAAVVNALTHVGLDLRGKPADLTALIKAWDVDATGYLADRPGWLDLPNGASVFIRPDGEVCASRPITEIVRLSGATPMPVSGTLEDWQTTIGRWSVGNPALIAGVAMGFVGPLLGPSRLDTVGINLHSKTSSGKSTVARAARS